MQKDAQERYPTSTCFNTVLIDNNDDDNFIPDLDNVTQVNKISSIILDQRIQFTCNYDEHMFSGNRFTRERERVEHFIDLSDANVVIEQPEEHELTGENINASTNLTIDYVPDCTQNKDIMYIQLIFLSIYCNIDIIRFIIDNF